MLPFTLDATLLVPYTKEAREHLSTQRFGVDIANINRAVGTMLGSQVTKDHPEGIPDDSIVVDCSGSAGMSFGAFVPRGVTLNVIGEANDYFGKGLSGGTLTLRPNENAAFRPNENIVAGNVAFYAQPRQPPKEGFPTPCRDLSPSARAKLKAPSGTRLHPGSN